jgi:hypothetical protein
LIPLSHAFAFRRAAAGAFHIATIAVASILAACGGGSDSATGASTEVPLAAETKNAQILATAADPAWTTIADEGEHFTVSGTQSVRYGTGSSWITRQVDGGGDCSNAAFGNDPYYGVVKVCQVAAAATPAPGGATWTTIASEGATFTVSGTQTVRYGSGNAWIERQVTGGGACSNDAFGGDPLYGVVKQCQLASSGTGWTRIAVEGDAFTLAGTATVRYGTGSSWITRTVSNGGTCSNGFFGSDPLYGVVKECDVGSDGGSAPPPPPPVVVPPPVTTAAVCTPPIAAVDTSTTAATVGDGTPASCTEAALRAAVNARGVVTFSCGAAPTTIAVSSTIDVPATRDTVIDGGSRITLDGGGRTRIFNIANPNYRSNGRGLTLQHIALRNARAPGSGYVAPNPSNPSCAYGYADGGGAAIQVRDAVLHVIDVDFQGNAAATPGPDIGGGAVFALGSLDVTIVGSRFDGNSGSNAGAVGALQSNLRIYNSAFTGNTANGIGQNTAGGAATGCAGVGHADQGGAGGNGGAVMIDGSDDTDVMVCGSQFVGNHANELAGALARTANGAPRRSVIDRSRFDANSARQGGALFFINSAPLEVLASTFSNNTATLIGAAQFANSQFRIVNTTFSGNEATRGLGGALFLGGNSASSLIQNATFADNKASGGAGYFSAAIFGDSNFPIVNTVFSRNTTADAGSPMQCTFASASGANDVQWPVDHVVGGAPDTACVGGIAFVDPLLGGLADNGGPTLTRAPAANSPLRGAGRNCPATDQRGSPRNTAACTIGAVE